MSSAITVIVPAWQCEHQIVRSLSSLAAQRLDGMSPPHLIVAVNDGRGESIAAAQHHVRQVADAGWRVEVIATPPGRRAAIAAAEDRAAAGARLYVDQDAILSPGAMAAFARAASDDGPARFVTFALTFDRSPSPIVRRFLRAWLALPYVTASPVVAGVFGVSRAGRARWDRLPALASDDKYVRLLFAPHERVRIADQRYQVLPDATVARLVRARARYVRGNRQLARVLPPDPARRHAGLARLLLRPARWPDVAVLAGVSALAHWQARRP